MESTTLKEHRLKMGLTQTQLGTRLGVSRKTVLNYEAGITQIPDTKAKLLNLIFSITKPTRKKRGKVLPLVKRTQAQMISDNLIETLLPFFVQLEKDMSEMKCELETIKLYLQLDELDNELDNDDEKKD